MNDRDDEIARLLAALGEPEPPDGLGERALAGARSVWERPSDRWLALWESRRLRLAWAAAVVALLAANVAVRTRWDSHRAPASASASARDRDERRELRAVVALPRLRVEYVGSEAAVGRETIHLTPQPAGPLPKSEDKS